MREIKFRAWDFKRNQMIIRPKMDYGGSGFWQLIREDNSCPDIPEDIEVMQFTGLKDKNGKEIYEGDILIWTRKHWYCLGTQNHNKDLKNRIHIYWDEDKLSLRYDMYDEKRCFGSGSINSESFTDERADENVIEVIGNKFENQELLE